MSDTEKAENVKREVPAGTQNAGKTATTKVLAASRESQDFQLVDTEELDNDIPCTDALPSQEDRKEMEVNESADSRVSPAAGKTLETKESSMAVDSPEGDNPPDEKIDPKPSVVPREEEMSADDEDEILGTPPSDEPPPSKVGSVRDNGVGNKRKAEPDNPQETVESAIKVLKTSLSKDVKFLDKRKHDQEDTAESNASDNSRPIDPNDPSGFHVTIEETRDTETEAEAVTEAVTEATALADAEAENAGEEKSISCVVDKCEMAKKHFGSQDGLDKNENLNNSAKSEGNTLLTGAKATSTDTAHVDGKPVSAISDEVKLENFPINSDDEEKCLTRTDDEGTSVINVDGKEKRLSSEDNPSARGDGKSSLDETVRTESLGEEANVSSSVKPEADCLPANDSNLLGKRKFEDAAAEDADADAENKGSGKNWPFNKGKSPGKEDERVVQKVPANSNSKSRMSIEVIFESCESDGKKPRAKELVQIDEEGEKIILDSSQEDSEVRKIIDDGDNAASDGRHVENVNISKSSEKSTTDSSKDGTLIFKSDGKMTNNSGEYCRTDTDTTVSLETDVTSNEPVDTANAFLKRKDKENLSEVKDVDRSVEPLLSISENEVNLSKEDNLRNKSVSDGGFNKGNTSSKALQVEKEVGIYVKLKCLLQIDESSKELLAKELLAVQCESTAEQRVNDTSASSLADISGNDNKDSSPGSVHSNPQLFALNPSRLSLVSSVSSSSSASSAASLAAARIVGKDGMHFSLPRAPAKHAKRSAHDVSQTAGRFDELFDRLSREWKNSQLLTTSVLSFLNAEITSADNCNASSGHLPMDDQMQKILSSTPEVRKEMRLKGTPKSTRRGKATKRKAHHLQENSSTPSKTAAKNHREGVRFGGTPTTTVGHRDNAKVKKLVKSDITEELSKHVFKDIPNERDEEEEEEEEEEDDEEEEEEEEVVEAVKVAVAVADAEETVVDELIGKEVFAKWSDNNYYPGRVVDKVKTKYKVNFYDGHSKLLIETFLIRIPKILNKGLSVYATTTQDDYGSSGIIVDFTERAEGDTHYTVETDDKGRLEVQIKDIFLSADQAQVFKEEVDVDPPSLPSTPKRLGQITLDNTVEGKRRSTRRVATPLFSTPKSRKRKESASSAPRLVNPEPSSSGLTPRSRKTAYERARPIKSEDVSSDSSLSTKDEILLGCVHPEIIGTANEQRSVKGTQRKIKGKARSKKRTDQDDDNDDDDHDEEIVQRFGPIPKENSKLFAGMSFLLTCASLENIDRYRTDDSKESNSETATENEEQWLEIPFIRDRLKRQITAAGGKVYEEFNAIPKDEYERTKLISNVPNNTTKSLLCLSVGIPSYNHKWIVRCCRENTIVNPAEEELPAGWSLEKQCYVEKFQRANKKPLINMIVIIPNMPSNKDFVEFWREICENAGAVIVLVDNPQSMEGFAEETVVVTNQRCPAWAVEKAYNLHIPLLSTTWVVQCLIEGKVCAFDAHPRYKYNYVQ